MKQTKALFTLVGLTVAADAAMAQAFSTGPGLAMTGGTVDPNWSVTVPATLGGGTASAVMLNHTAADFPYNVYVANDAASQWISFTADGGDSLSPALTTGNYTYTTSVNFGGGGLLSGYLWSDNAVLDVSVGANSYGTAPLATVYGDGSVGWFQTGTAFSLNTVFTGVQTVAFTIRNGVPGETYDRDPTAFRTELSLSPVPEPFTVGLGVAALAVGLRRRKNR
ncbi:MAG: hypothetical protein M9921_05730 [Fimbriimonadaceae bacterium]|nr:hypothetical protein [Chthonomonadaceae bacterium]MCO5296340.1 hypothetical protein [Fimbriimonadaceae bacterium]